MKTKIALLQNRPSLLKDQVTPYSSTQYLEVALKLLVEE